MGSAGRVVIGDNVFIGMKSTILKGVHIGNNVIIGANSLVNKNIPDNCVAAGNPCKVIMSLDAYYEKRKAVQVEEAKELVGLYRERYGKEPDEEALSEFFWLFTDDCNSLPQSWEEKMKLCGTYNLSKERLKRNNKQYKRYERLSKPSLIKFVSMKQRRMIEVKVCILSMQRINNMGSLLQSYALKTTVERLGHEVEFLDIIKRDEDYNLLGDCENKYRTEKEKQGLVGKVKKIDRYTLNRLKIKRQSLKQNEVFELFRKKYLAIEKRSPQYDVCIIGSDEVFNCLNAGAWGFTSQLFGNVAEAEKVITYAASCGSMEYEKLPVKVADRIRQSFTNVAAFSVRDGNTYSFVSNLSDKRVTENLDPVLVYAFDREIEAACLPKLPEHYCVVYSYYNRIHTADEITAIKDFCQRHRLTPVAVGAPQFWIKDYIVCSPFQCLKVFKHADFIITDTFHGAIFSVKYAKKFAVITRPSNENKLCDLINKLGIQEHWLRSFMQLSQVYQIEKKADRINGLITQEQKNTLRYLKNNIV